MNALLLGSVKDAALWWRGPDEPIEELASDCECEALCTCDEGEDA